MSEPTKFLLREEQIPTHWVNLLPDVPGEPLPPLHPGTGQPAVTNDVYFPVEVSSACSHDLSTSGEAANAVEARCRPGQDLQAPTDDCSFFESLLTHQPAQSRLNPQHSGPRIDR